MLFFYHPDQAIAEAMQLVIKHDNVRIFTAKDTFLGQCATQFPSNILFFESTPVENAELAIEALRVYPDMSPPKVTVLCFSQPKTFTELISTTYLPEAEAFIDAGVLSLLPLPCEIDALREAIATDSRSEVNDRITENIRALKNRLEDEWDRTIRHQMGNARAAARLLNGAIRFGDYNFSQNGTINSALSAYIKLFICIENITPEKREKLQQITHAPDINKNGYNKRLKQYVKLAPEYQELRAILNDRSTLEKKAHPDKGKNPWQGTILIIDDQIDIWQPVWEFIFRNQVEVVATGEEGLEKIEGGDKNYHCVLLDIDLGEGRENGLSILQQIKNIRFELPVVMMSNFDHATLTKLCLSNGADNYFIKEIQDSRDSKEYYNSLINMIASLPAVDNVQRTLWKQFIQLEPQIEAVDKEYATKIGALTRKGFYYLTLNAEHFLPAKLLIPEGSGDATPDNKNFSVAYNALFAADEIFIARIILSDSDTTSHIIDRENAYSYLKQMDDGARPSFETLLNRARFATNIIQENGLKNAQSCRHATGETTSNQAQNCIRDVLNLAEKLINGGIVNKPITATVPVCCFTKDDLQTSCSLQLNTFAVSRGANLSEHKTIGKEGAACFKEGLKDCSISQIQPKAPYTKVLFIDDEGEDGGWHKELKDYFIRKGGYILETATSYQTDTDLEEYALVILDLIFPDDHEAGLTHLHEIKKKNPSIPVIMLTADASGFSSRKCLFNGADDYFTKKSYSNSQGYVSEFDQMVSPYLEQTQDTRRRSWWEAITAFNEKFKRPGTIGFTEESARNIQAYNGLDQDYIKKKTDVGLVGYLKESYFYYLQAINDNLIAEYRVKRLLSSRQCTPAEDALLSLAKFVELAAKLQQIIDDPIEEDPINQIGMAIPIMSNTDNVKRKFKEIWAKRNSIKDGNEYSDIHTDYKEFEPILDSFKFHQPFYKPYKQRSIQSGRVTGIQNWGMFVKIAQNTTGKVKWKEQPRYVSINADDYTVSQKIRVRVTNYNHGRLRLTIDPEYRP